LHRSQPRSSERGVKHVLGDITINVLPGRVMRTVFLPLAAAIAVFVGMLLLTTLYL
jgi:hypothetical protein